MGGPNPQRIGRYLLYDEIGSGGMAVVHLGKLVAAGGFSRTVALKRLHPHLAKQPEFVTRLLDEARITCSVHHPNVVQTLDVVAEAGEILLVFEYVHGAPLARLLRLTNERGEGVDAAIVCALVASALHGLHAAHEAVDERGAALQIVHRDVSPQNLLVGLDGVLRVVDFGIARALGRITNTQDGAIRGKLAYMSPEQMRGQAVDRRTDVYAASVVLWEALAGRRLYARVDGEVNVESLLKADVPPLPVDAALSEVVMRGLARDPDARYPTAREMALALERAHPLASTSCVGEWVRRLVGSSLRERSDRFARVEGHVPAADRLPSDGDATRSAIVVPISSSSLAVTTTPTEARGSIVDPISTSALATPAAPRRQSGTRARWSTSVGAVVAGSLLTLSIVKAIGTTTRPAAVTQAPPPTATVAAHALPSPGSSDDPAPAESARTRPVTSSPAPAPPVVKAHVRRAVAASQAPARPSSVPTSSCDPPYTFDAQNRRHFKRECL